MIDDGIILTSAVVEKIIEHKDGTTKALCRFNLMHNPDLYYKEERVFYDDEIEVHEGDEVSIEVEVNRVVENGRDQKI
jgi:hypothetical protein